MASSIQTTKVRLAEPSDARRIAQIQVDTWRSAYSGLVPEEFLSGMSINAKEQAWRSRIGHPQSPVYVATRLSDCIGFCHVAPARDQDTSNSAEVTAIYVSPEFQRQGVGHMLVSSALRFAASSHYESIYLWVLALNHAGRAFYERTGLTPDGHQKQIHISGAILDEVRYYRHIR